MRRGVIVFPKGTLSSSGAVRHDFINLFGLGVASRQADNFVNMFGFGSNTLANDYVNPFGGGGKDDFVNLFQFGSE